MQAVLQAIMLTTVMLGVPSQAAEPPATARTLVLVRHGHYDADPAADATRGPGLSSLGVAQAQLVGARLAAEFPARFDARHASPMQRARDTAGVIAGTTSLPVFELDEDLAECTPPTRRNDVMQSDAPETFEACRQKLDRVFARYFRAAGDSERDELLVCHGNVIRYLVTRALQVDSESWLQMSVGHASITRIRIEPDGGFKVIAVGDVGHLPTNLRTGASGDPERSLALPSLRLR